jgi:hypothetical protein
MQSIIDSIQSQQTLDKAVNDMFNKLESFKAEMKDKPDFRDLMHRILNLIAIRYKFDRFASLNLKPSQTSWTSKLDFNNNLDENIENEIVSGRYSTVDEQDHYLYLNQIYFIAHKTDIGRDAE